mmetsp:Transcript_5772/g.8877  ORF Transcript_5772/g.8877 Transcript_5772/m.8877 type:complete len:82 (-) Transcript_5772:137-382(-)
MAEIQERVSTMPAQDRLHKTYQNDQSQLITNSITISHSSIVLKSVVKIEINPKKNQSRHHRSISTPSSPFQVLPLPSFHFP